MRFHVTIERAATATNVEEAMARETGPRRQDEEVAHLRKGPA